MSPRSRSKKLSSVWSAAWQRGAKALARQALGAGRLVLKQSLRPAVAQARKVQTHVQRQAAPPPGVGDWLPGAVVVPGGALRYKVFRPLGMAVGERLPLLVMLHGCGQDARSFACSTRMNSLAARERFLVLYPEQNRLSNPQGCWNWFDTDSGRAAAEAALIIQALDQVSLMYPVDRGRVAVAGLSAGVSMAALLATRYPARFKAVVMHSGIAPGAAHSGLSALAAMKGRRTPQQPLTKLPLLAHLSPVAGVPWPPLLVIQGRADVTVAARNGQAAVQLWAQVTCAQPEAGRSQQRGRRYPMTITHYKRQRHTMATLVEVAQLGHAWSGGAARQPFSDALGPDASRMAWAFAAKQFRA